MKDRRKYQRYAVNHGVNTPDQFEVTVAGEVARLVNFSVGDLYILSKLPFSPGEINISVTFKNHGRIDLIGTVVQVRKEGEMWGIAIDLTETYNLNTLRRV